MTEKLDYFNSLQRINEFVDRLVVEGISRDTACDAALMAGLGEITGVETGKSMRAILQISAPGEKARRSPVLHQMYHAFSCMLVARDYPLSEIAMTAMAWGHAGATNSFGLELLAEALGMFANSENTEGMN